MSNQETNNETASILSISEPISTSKSLVTEISYNKDSSTKQSSKNSTSSNSSSNSLTTHRHNNNPPVSLDLSFANNFTTYDSPSTCETNRVATPPAQQMNGLSISELCFLFCCPPIPASIAAKLAFLPPEPSYSFSSITTNGTNNSNVSNPTSMLNSNLNGTQVTIYNLC